MGSTRLPCRLILESDDPKVSARGIRSYEVDGMRLKVMRAFVVIILAVEALFSLSANQRLDRNYIIQVPDVVLP